MQGKCDRQMAMALAKSDRCQREVSWLRLEPKNLSRKLAKNILLAAGGLVVAGGAQAADLPSLKAAPVEYVRICDAYGAGFFYIPGTDTCLKVGGLVLAEVRGFDPSFSISGNSFYANGQSHSAIGFIPSPSQFSNARSRDAVGYGALGRIELDARTQSEWGTLRSFLRVDSYFGSSINAATGSLFGLGQGVVNTTAGVRTARETAIVNKAFIQFAGLTAGRAQSLFDFYADAYNYASLRGSNATVALLAYTATFGNGFSGSLSFEDQASRRAGIGSTIASTGTVTVNGISSGSFQGTPAGTRVPDIVGNVRLDQPWGAVQVSAAAHQVRASLFASGALATPATAYSFPALTSNSYGFAVQGGVQLNADMINPGDKLWLQGAYEQGAFGYIAGNNLSFDYGAVNGNRFYGAGITSMNYSFGWNPQMNADCVFTASGACERQNGWAFVGAYRHYWIPTLSSSIFGSYMQVNYSGNALAGFGGAVGVSNLKEARVGTNLVWTPIKGFDIGGEFFYTHLTQSRPVGLASDATLTANGLPAFQPNANEYEGRIRLQRLF